VHDEFENCAAGQAGGPAGGQEVVGWQLAGACRADVKDTTNKLSQ